MKPGCGLYIVFIIVFQFSSYSSEPDSLIRLARKIPPVPQAITDTLRYYQNVHPVTLYDCIDGFGILTGIRLKETSQLYYQKYPGDTLKQLTDFSEPVFGASICPDTSKHLIMYGKDSIGNEVYQLYLLDLKTGRSGMISDGRSRYGDYLWSPDGGRFVFTSTKRNGKDWGIYISSIDSPNVAVPLLEQEGSWSVEDWSPDGSQLLISRYISRNETRLYTFNIDEKKMVAVGDTTIPHAFEDCRWAEDGKGLFIVTDENTEFRVLYYYDLKTGDKKPLTENIHWDIREMELSRDRKKMAFTTNEHGFSQLYIMNTANYKKRRIPMPTGVIYILKFFQGDSTLLFTMNRPVATDNVYVLDLKKGNSVSSCVKGIDGPDTKRIISPVIIQYPTFDSVGGKKREISCFYYKPKKAGPLPCVIFIHGGPESQFWPYYNPTYQYLCNNQGIAILAPDVRGSNGYGKSFLLLDNDYKRENSVKDIGALLDWIRKQPELDSTRVAVMGGSYGGYMSLASMVHYNDCLRAGVDIYGIGDFVTFLENTDESRRDLRRVEYGDERDPQMRKFLESVSPINHVDKITRPMLIIQGASDPRVPLEESNRMVDALVKRGVPVWYLLFENEGHGFNRKINKDYEEGVIINFLKKYL